MKGVFFPNPTLRGMVGLGKHPFSGGIFVMKIGIISCCPTHLKGSGVFPSTKALLKTAMRNLCSLSIFTLGT